MVFLLVVFVFGLAVGSFLNVVIDRLPRGESIIHGRSHCDSCKKTLQWHDLIPLFSFLFLKGKCRYCHSPIGWESFLVELLTAILFVCVFLPFVFPFALPVFTDVRMMLRILYDLFIISAFLCIFFIDLREGIIPDKIIYSATIVSFLYVIFFIPAVLLTHLLSAFGAFLFFLLLFFITKKKGMGFGDVKLSFLLGLFLGFPQIIIALYIAFLTGAVIGSILIIGGKKKFFGGTIPFGPFLIIGVYTSYFIGSLVLQAILVFLHL